MKLSTLALPALLGIVATTAQAQSNAPSSVTLYGIVDTGIEYLNNANAAGDKLVRVPTLTGLFPSRLGVRGSEDLGNGLRAIFTIEAGIGLDTGAAQQGSRTWGRQSYVGLAGPWGAVTVGRQYTMTFWGTVDADLIGPAIYAIGSLDSYLPNARSDNSIAYKGTFSGVTLGATYSLGRDTATTGGPAATNCPGESAADSKACKQYSAMVKFDSPSFGVAAHYDRMNGGTTAAFGLNTSDKTDTRSGLNGYVKFAGVKVGGGFIQRKNEGSATQPKSTLAYLGASYPFTSSFTFEGQVADLNFKDSDNDARLYVLKGVYGLSPRTQVYLTTGHVSNSGTSAISVSAGGSVGAGLSQTGVMTGIKHTF